MTSRLRFERDPPDLMLAEPFVFVLHARIRQPTLGRHFRAFLTKFS